MIPLECEIKSITEWRMESTVINNEAENTANTMIRCR